MRKPQDRVLHQTECFPCLDFLANGQNLTEVPALDELHDDEELACHGVLVNCQNLDNVAMLQGHADLALAHEQLDPCLVLAPAPAEDLDGHDPPRTWIV